MDCPWKVGQAYLIRTITFSWTGRLTAVTDHELVLEDAAWIAHLGRYHEAVDAGHLEEIEPREGPVILGRAAIVDAVEWHADLPRQAK